MNIYKGKKINNGVGGQTVFVNDVLLNKCHDVCNHSPDGFNWGYGGSGAAQLALAILVDYFKKKKKKALINYQQFKWDFISKFGEEWELTTNQIENWYLTK